MLVGDKVTRSASIVSLNKIQAQSNKQMAALFFLEQQENKNKIYDL